MTEKEVMDQLPGARDLGEASLIPKDIHSIIRQIPLFQDLSASELQALEHFLYVYKVKRGAVVFREGEPTDYMLIVAEGAVRILKRDEHNEEKLIAVAERGNTLGEMALLDGGPRSATCVADQDTTFIALTRSRFGELTQAYPVLALRVLIRLGSALSRRLRRVNEQLVELLDV